MVNPIQVQDSKEERKLELVQTLLLFEVEMRGVGVEERTLGKRKVKDQVGVDLWKRKILRRNLVTFRVHLEQRGKVKVEKEGEAKVLSETEGKEMTIEALGRRKKEMGRKGVEVVEMVKIDFGRKEEIGTEKETRTGEGNEVRVGEKEEMDPSEMKGRIETEGRGGMTMIIEIDMSEGVTTRKEVEVEEMKKEGRGGGLEHEFILLYYHHLHFITISKSKGQARELRTSRTKVSQI